MPDPEVFADMPFPAYGLDLLTGYGFQRPGTTPVGQNVRYFESITQRGRGGSRPGLGKYIHEAVPVSNSVTSSLLIQHLNTIVDPKEVALLATVGDGPGTGNPPFPNATLNPETPDEVGPRVTGDDWVPTGGWGVQPRRRTNQGPVKVDGYQVVLGILVSANYAQGGNQGTITARGNALAYLNGTLVSTLNGAATWPSQANPSFDTDFYANDIASTDLLMNPNGRIFSVLPAPLLGYHDSAHLLEKSLFVFGNPAGFAKNNIRLDGTWGISAQGVVSGGFWAQATVSVLYRILRNDGTWSKRLLATVDGFGTFSPDPDKVGGPFEADVGESLSFDFYL